MSVNITFDKIVDKVFSGFKKITPALAAVSIASGLLLFLPKSILQKMSLENISTILKQIIGCVFIISTVLIFAILISIPFQALLKKYKYNKIVKRLRADFLKLTNDQKKIIIKMLKSSDKSIHLESTSGNTVYLVQKNFIYQPQQFCTPDEYSFELVYVPHPWLIDLYNQEPDIFK